jgi:polysaccharide biosynthesis protein PslG
MSRLSGRRVPRRALSRLTSLAAAFAVLAAVAAPTPASAARHMAGVQSHVLWGNVDIAEMDRQLDEMQRGHVAITRVDVGWASVEEEGRGKINWSYVHRLDHLVDGANARGIKLLLTYTTTPCWASAAPSSLKDDCNGAWWHRDVQNYPPRHASDFADSFGWVVERYGNRVYSWEIWNEPNLDYFFRSDDPIGDYASIVRAGYNAAKDADRRPIIVAGSLAESDYEWTEALYDHGVKGHFDAWSIHPYAAGYDPLKTEGLESPRYSFKDGIPAVRKVLHRHGDRKPIWLTEWGYSTCNVRGGPSWANCVDYDEQARRLKRGFVQMRKWNDVPVGIWFNLKNTTDDPGDRVGNYGLLTRDGHEKPAFDTFSDIARKLARDGGGDEPKDPPADPGPKPDPKPRPPLKKRAVVHVARKGRYVTLRGRAPRRQIAKLLLYRQNEDGVFKRRPTYRWWFPVNGRGRFSLRLRGRALETGTWRIVVRPTGGAHWATAAAVLSG